MAHLKVCHHYDINMLKEITKQLAAVAAQDHQGFWCSYCGELLSSGEIDDDIAPLPAAHMPECAYVKLVTLMISFPVWHKKPFQEDQWPTLHEVARASQQMQRSLMQFNVDPSAPVDTLGSSFESMAESGLVLMSDPPFLQAAKYRCLMCQRSFFTPWKFVQHLHTHTIFDRWIRTFAFTDFTNVSKTHARSVMPQSTCHSWLGHAPRCSTWPSS